MALPKFVCIGAQKAGTTWLFEMLAQNPSIWFPPLKEVHFFNVPNPGEEAKENKRQKLLKLSHKAERQGKTKGSLGEAGKSFLDELTDEDIMSESWYRKLFSHPESDGRISGEITPAYLTLANGRIDYMKSLLEGVKIVLIVREPVARAISQLKMDAGRNTVPAVPDTLRQRVMKRFGASYPKRISDEQWNRALGSLVKQGRGDYSRHIPRWQEKFSKDEFLILPFGDLKSNPTEFLREVESFIGAQPHDKYKAANKKIHVTREVEVPEWVVEKVKTLMKPQQDFLKHHFGEAFYERTK